MKKIISVALAAVLMGTAVAVPVSAPLNMSVTAEAATIKQTQVTNLKTDPGVRRVVLTWDYLNDQDCTGYRVYIKRPGEMKYTKYKDTNSTFTNACTVTGLVPGENYYFAVSPLYGSKAGKISIGVKAKPKSSNVKYKWINAYRKIIRENNTAPSCSLYDLTGDGVPELILANDTSHFSTVGIYSYHNGKVHRITSNSDVLNYESFVEKDNADFGSFGRISYLPDSGMIVSHMSSMIGTNNVFFTIENDKAKVAFTTFVEQHEEEPYFTYYINDKQVSKADYSKAVKKYDGVNVVELGGSYYTDWQKYFNTGLDIDSTKYRTIEQVFSEIEENGYKDPALEKTDLDFGSY